MSDRWIEDAAAEVFFSLRVFCDHESRAAHPPERPRDIVTFHYGRRQSGRDELSWWSGLNASTDLDATVTQDPRKLVAIDNDTAGLSERRLCRLCGALVPQPPGPSDDTVVEQRYHEDALPRFIAPSTDRSSSSSVPEFADHRHLIDPQAAHALVTLHCFRTCRLEWEGTHDRLWPALDALRHAGLSEFPLQLLVRTLNDSN